MESSCDFWHEMPGEYFYKGMLLADHWPAHVMDRMRDYSVRENDIFVVGTPKSGTTRTLQALWSLIHGEKDEDVPWTDRMPFLEMYIAPLDMAGMDQAAKIPMDSQRIMKSHSPPNMIPKQALEKNCKIVVCMRNPKDLAVSTYHFYRMNSAFGNFTGTWDEFYGMFKAGHNVFGPCFDFAKKWWDLRYNPNIYFNFYEDMNKVRALFNDDYDDIKDFLGSLTRLSEFLALELDDERAERTAKTCMFDVMRNNPACNGTSIPDFDHGISHFIRKGMVGDWKNYFTASQSEEFDDVITEKLRGYSIPYQYEL